MDKPGKTVNDLQNAVMMKMSNPASFSHKFYFLLSVCFSECCFCDKNKYRQYLQPFSFWLLLLKLYPLSVPIIIVCIVMLCPAKLTVFYAMVIFIRDINVLVSVLVKAVLLSSNSAKLDLELLT